ncbi:DUF368 domain-containing protein [Parasalinivibrio latis]
MGAADVVPGVSGGTIAFITGIYDTLLESLRRINPSLIGIIRKQGFSAACKHINLTFLVSLLAGILTSIFTLAKGISWMLTTHPIIIWSFFFGLIIISIVHMLKQVTRWNLVDIVTMLAGIGFAYFITVANPLTLAADLPTVFIAGSIAICAMILPGISGSFILLLLGLYTPILGAVKSFDVVVLVTFAAGALIGILSFSHLLSWLLAMHRNPTITFLTGLMIGTLGKIWPWKETLSWRINSHGEQVPLVERNLMPWNFEHIVGQPPHIWMAIVAMVLGVLSVWALERFANNHR